MGGFTSAIGGLVGTVGGIVGGSKAADAAKGQAEALRAAADRASGMAAFTPYGMTTAFGTSKFEDGKGSYTLSPELKALQDRLFGAMGSYDPTKTGAAAQPIYGGAESLFNLGSQYLAKSPEEAAADYISKQQALLSGTREQQLSALRSKQIQTGRTGLATGGTTTGMAATNPEMAAYYNALANQDLQLAAKADQAGMERTKFGAGLFGTGGELLGMVPKLTAAGYAPLEAQLGLLKTTEAMGQDPYRLSLDLANQYSSAGARQAGLYLQPQQAAANAYAQYQGYSPMAVGLQGLGQSIQSFGSPSSWTGIGGGSSTGGWFDNLIGNPSTASRYGTNVGSQQTSMLAEQEKGFW